MGLENVFSICATKDNCAQGSSRKKKPRLAAALEVGRGIPQLLAEACNS